MPCGPIDIDRVRPDVAPSGERRPVDLAAY